jgi:hypothetical protein
MKEKEIQTKILILVGSKKGTRLFRNTVGIAKLQDGSTISFGLSKGSADLIGWHSIVITEEMVGKKIAVFLSVEVKTKKGKISPHQQNWHDVIKEAGGIAIIGRSPEEVSKAIELLTKN